MKIKWNKINVPNKLLLLRMFLVLPLILLFVIYLCLTGSNSFKVDENAARAAIFSLIFIIFVGAMVTDFLDGYIARAKNQVTNFGKLWDPIADKIMTTTTLIFLSVLGMVPVWITVVFILRDIIVDALRVVMTKNNVSVQASWYGKVKTFTQSIGIGLILFIAIFVDFPAEISSSLTLKRNIFDSSTVYVITRLSVLLINSILVVALVFSVLSGIQYYKKVNKYISIYSKGSTGIKTQVLDIKDLESFDNKSSQNKK